MTVETNEYDAILDDLEAKNGRPTHVTIRQRIEDGELVAAELMLEFEDPAPIGEPPRRKRAL